jgi:hypothetical protein
MIAVEKPSVRVTWWKIVVAILAPIILVPSVAISMVGFMVVFNLVWSQLGIPQQTGYFYSMALITALLFILYLSRSRSQYARIWLAFPLFSAVLLAFIGVGVFGLSSMVFTVILFTLAVGIWFYISWVVWLALATY